ncbi:uncharacterized protein BKA55DRAFT_682569 [Fusarium redolens]|uniref:Uncharacterized protein n=1 Tax=Fusarium redolens TaxID=48865 RepID=A0A9P9KW60_FUSRE|nr:uncharacterized protein BKA55DRAFT_682569 [Fusarium redolens]KAH7269478.1 hypothetical protein BKA55DRAFT_682569 [Fusarium redolens]
MDLALSLQQDGENCHSQDEVKPSAPAPEERDMNNIQRHPHARSRTPEPQVDQQVSNSDPPDTPGALEPFDWDEFEARYEAALQEADEREREILKEADALSKYFKIWAASASAHDDERAAKRLQTRRRFVNLAEDKMERKQQHYDQVVRAFESALALLKSHLGASSANLAKAQSMPDLALKKNQDMPQSNDESTTSAHVIPNISPDDLFAFHKSHFSHTALAAFGSEFIDSPPRDQTQDDAVDDTWEEEDDDLGYYPDGVKRTLTDAQIEIFRHSELETLRKEKERAKQLGSKETAPSSEAMDLSDDTPISTQTKNLSSTLPASFQSNKKRKKKKGLKRPRPEPKPDLRKRTWDVVDKGLDTLEYD